MSVSSLPARDLPAPLLHEHGREGAYTVWTVQYLLRLCMEVLREEAFCGMEAEERGQGEAIARNLYEMSALKTPILSVLIGEGGSGGALAMAVADEVWILENAVYSILSPEGYAAILWKDGSQAARAAKAMKLTSYDLYKAGFVEKIIPEPEGYTLDSIINVFDNLEENISIFLKNSKSMTEEERVEQRYQRFRSM